jgi:hypothetical protein
VLGRTIGAMVETSAPVPYSSYPVVVDLPREQPIARWRPLAHIFMAIPHIIVMYALSIVAGVMTFIGFFAVLFTKRWPASMLGLVVMYERYTLRVTSFILLMRESYPPFEFPQELTDPGDDPPARYTLEDPGELTRLAPLYQWFLAIPHYIVLFLLDIAAFIVYIAGWFVVLFTGRWPEGMAQFLISVVRWNARVTAYANFLTNQYPPFSLE